jgi:hypothetical protein
MKLTPKERFVGLVGFGFLVGISHIILPLGIWLALIIGTLGLIYVEHYGI